MNKKIAGFVCAVFIASASFTTLRSDSVMPPDQSETETAEETSGLLINSLVSGLVNVFVATHAGNVDEGSHAISLTFDDWNQNIRLVGESDPLSENNRPMDAFEMTALTAALGGGADTSVERVRGRWFFRSSVPLANSIAQCALCHTNYGAPSGNDYVGALMVRVPID